MSSKALLTAVVSLCVTCQSMRVKKPGLTVRTRSGFFGMTEEDANRLKQTTGK